jgi:hypothetical protein
MIKLSDIQELIKELKFLNSDSTTIEEIIDKCDDDEYFPTDILGYEYDFSEYIICGRKRMNDKLFHKNFSIESWMYLLYCKEETTIILAFDCYPTTLWYYCHDPKSLEQLKNIITTYQQDNYELELSHSLRGFVGTEEMLNSKMEDIEKFFIVSKYCENLVWGSSFYDYPFRDISEDSSIFHLARCASYALRQESNSLSISTRTEHSKSIIRFEYHNGAFLVDVKYNPVENKNISEINNILDVKFPKDMPNDVLSILMNYPFVTHKDIYALEPLSEHHVSLSLIVANTKEMFYDIIGEMDKLLTNNKIDSNVNKFIYEVRGALKANLEIDKIFDNDFILSVIKYKEELKDEKLFKAIKEKLYKLTKLDKDDEHIEKHIDGLVKQLINKE